MELHRACRHAEGILARVKIGINPKSLTGCHTRCSWLRGLQFPPHVSTPTWLGSSIIKSVDLGFFLPVSFVHIADKSDLMSVHL